MGEVMTTPQLVNAYTRYQVKTGDMVYPVYNDELPGGAPGNLGQRYPAGILLKIEFLDPASHWIGDEVAADVVAFHLFVDGQVEVFGEPYWSISRVFRPIEDI